MCVLSSFPGPRLFVSEARQSADVAYRAKYQTRWLKFRKSQFVVGALGPFDRPMNSHLAEIEGEEGSEIESKVFEGFIKTVYCLLFSAQLTTGPPACTWSKLNRSKCSPCGPISKQLRSFLFWWMMPAQNRPGLRCPLECLGIILSGTYCSDGRVHARFIGVRLFAQETDRLFIQETG